MRELVIDDCTPGEGKTLGALMVAVYSSLPGFPSPTEQPRYYDMLANIRNLAERPGARVLVARMNGEVAGGVVYLGDMAHYGSGGTAGSRRNASGIRLLAVDPEWRGHGIGKALTEFCIELARKAGHREVVLHTTAAMQTAWKMYEGLGFRRDEELDFMQEALPVYGFSLPLGS